MTNVEKSEVAPIQRSTCRECGTIIGISGETSAGRGAAEIRQQTEGVEGLKELAWIPSSWVSDPVLSPSPSLR